ncbi:MAG: type II secretion system protein [Gammaproteobacteria bacterium]|nr:type II secretion system protein [Gammaproteobacteria bacterium]
MKPTFGPQCCAGFTLLELIATMLILAVLTVTVSMRWSATDSTIAYQADLLARNLRHVQMLAMTWGQSLHVTGAGASYLVVCVTGTPSPPCNASPVIDPATGSALSVTLSNNASVSPTTVEFDSLGRPVNAGVLLTTARVFTLSGAGQTWSATVAPITGFVSVSSP